jgi:hypothetical protein
MVTHEDEVAARAKRVVRLRDGVLQSDVKNEPAARKEAALRAVQTVTTDSELELQYQAAASAQPN